VTAGIASPVFVGRRPELTLLLAAVERAAAGEPAVVLVGGEAGVGKTRLVEEAGAHAAAAGARVLTGACVELGGDRLPLAPLADALRVLARSTPERELSELLGPARRELARLLPELDPEAALASGQAARTSQLVELVLGVVERLAAKRPLMLVLEDLHWADGATLELMAFLVRALRGVGVLLVGTYRSDELHRRHPLRPLISGWDRVRTVDRFELGRFARDEVATQLEAIRGAPPPAGLLDLVLERSEGNAFLVEEIAGAVRAGADPGYLPPSLRDMLLVRAEQLSDGAQKVLRTVAVAGRWVPDGLLAAVTTLDEAALYAALRETVDHHLLVIDDSGRGYAFRHALAREAVYDDMLPGERVRLHTAYGEALTAEPGLAGDAGVAAALAYHWYAAHDLPRAVTASIDAARAAGAAYAPAEAQRHLERVIELWPQVPDAEARCGIDRGEALRLASEAAHAAGDLERALTMLDEALSEPAAEADPERRAILRVRRSFALRSLGRSEEAIPDLEAALAALPADPPSLARALVLSKLAAVRAQVLGFGEASAAAEAAVAAARAVGAREQEADAQITLGTALANLGDSDAGLDQLRAGLDLAMESGDHETALRGYVNLSDALGIQGHYEQAAETAREGMTLAERVGQARGFGAYLGGNLIEPQVRLGRWDEAAAGLEDLLAREPAGIFAAWLLELRAELAVHRGQIEGVEDELRRIGAIVGADDMQYHEALAYIGAEAARGRGEPGVAREIVATALAAATTAVSNRYAWPLVWLGLRIEADLAVHAPSREAPLPDDARARVSDLAALGAELPTVTARARGYRSLVGPEEARVSGTRGDWPAAVATWRSLGEPHMLAYALMRHAEASAAAGDRETAEDAAREAAEHLRGLGARPLLDELLAVARRARLAVDGTPEPAAPADGPLAGYGLTDREREVLDLVAEGRSNSQIGAQLFITRKTASVHVSNILAKLGVASRGEAAALLHRHRP
jgi:DNA-binding CsgD family transcriptional regulator/tetratricopeptide (TPR) repeat protein